MKKKKNGLSPNRLSVDLRQRSRSRRDDYRYAYDGGARRFVDRLDEMLKKKIPASCDRFRRLRLASLPPAPRRRGQTTTTETVKQKRRNNRKHRPEHRIEIKTTAHHFASLQPPAAGALLQDFALLLGVVAALQRRLLGRFGRGRGHGGRRVRPAATGRHRAASSVRRRRSCSGRCRTTHYLGDGDGGRTRTAATAVRRRHHRRHHTIDTRESTHERDGRTDGTAAVSRYGCPRLSERKPVPSVPAAISGAPERRLRRRPYARDFTATRGSADRPTTSHYGGRG